MVVLYLMHFLMIFLCREMCDAQWKNQSTKKQKEKGFKFKFKSPKLSIKFQFTEFIDKTPLTLIRAPKKFNFRPTFAIIIRKNNEFNSRGIHDAYTITVSWLEAFNDAQNVTTVAPYTETSRVCISNSVFHLCFEPFSMKKLPQMTQTYKTRFTNNFAQNNGLEQ